ncbi:unnamed protein product [Ectocarpus sp. 12 AP-2014]
MVACRHQGCAERASFGVEGGRVRAAEFCSGHAENGMVDFCKKTGGHPGCCMEHSSCGMQGSKNCSRHGNPGMMVKFDVKRCGHPICTKWPSYGAEGCRMAGLCPQLTKDRMTYVVEGRGQSPRQHTDDNETLPFSVSDSKTAEFCSHAQEANTANAGQLGRKRPACGVEGTPTIKLGASNSKAGTANVVASKRRKLCKHPGCNTKPLFGEAGTEETKFCWHHSKPGMVNVTTKRCGHSGCGATPSYGVEGCKVREFCPRHAKPGMVDVVARRCGNAGCATMPSHGVDGSKMAEFCPRHAKDGMVDVFKRKRFKLTTASLAAKQTNKKRLCSEKKEGKEMKNARVEEDDTLLGRSSERHSRVIKRRAKEEGKATEEKTRVDEDDELVRRSGGERRSRVIKRRAKRTPRRGSAAEREGRGAEVRRTEAGEKRKRALFLGVTFVEEHDAEFLGERAKRVRRFKTLERKLRNKVTEGNMNPLRDTVRVLATETQGYRVSCVSKVSVSRGPGSAAKGRPVSRRHLLETDMSNTTASRGLLRGVKGKWGDVKFEKVLLDHFWLPDSETWLNKNYMANDGGLIRNLISMTKPETRLLSDDFEVILPINRGFLELLLPHFSDLDKHFTVAFLVGQGLNDLKKSHLALQAGDLIPDDIMMGVYGKNKERQLSILGVKEPTQEMVKVLRNHGVEPWNFGHARFLRLTKSAGPRRPILSRWRKMLRPSSWTIWPTVSHRWRFLRQRCRLTSTRRYRTCRSNRRGGFVGEWSSSNCYLASLVVLLASRSRVLL